MKGTTKLNEIKGRQLAHRAFLKTDLHDRNFVLTALNSIAATKLRKNEENLCFLAYGIFLAVWTLELDHYVPLPFTIYILSARCLVG